MKKVLVVEDGMDIQEYYKKALEGKVEIISAYSIKSAMFHFNENPDLDAIVMDACLPNPPPNTLGITKRFRSTFKGPMIAASSDSGFRKMLMNAGCDHESKKNDIPQKVRELLGV